ncbi:GGDEF domain-containing protein [Aquibaculum sediminis]|uniref:GGDEF domain-containing protein n=1 Tax=Aquibaculum sediminis TaxID=3231907 RepID=UPI003456DDCA
MAARTTKGPPSRLHPVTGEFRDRATEAAFRESILASVQRDSRFSLCVASAIILSFSIADFSFLGASQESWLLLALRLTVSGCCLFFAFYLGRHPVLLTRPWLHSVAPIVIALCIILIVPLRPMTLPTQFTAVIIALLAFYLFVPNLLPGILLSSFLLTAGFLFAAWLCAGLPPVRVLTHGLLLTMANLVGFGTALRLARLERRQFALLLDERHSNHRLTSAMAEQQRLEEQLRQRAERDDLTGISNRRHFIEQAESAWAQNRAQARPFSLCIFDLDHFKRINDTWGHDGGDRTLQCVTAACAQALRPGDLLGRFGGEEFMVAFPETDLEQACAIAERLRETIASLALPEPLTGAGLTVTLGVATAQPGESTLEPAIKRADDALYRGKRSGRNRVERQVDADLRPVE